MIGARKSRQARCSSGLDRTGAGASGREHQSHRGYLRPATIVPFRRDHPLTVLVKQDMASTEVVPHNGAGGRTNVHLMCNGHPEVPPPPPNRRPAPAGRPISFQRTPGSPGAVAAVKATAGFGEPALLAAKIKTDYSTPRRQGPPARSRLGTVTITGPHDPRR